MTYLNGGYSIIKKDDANIFSKVNDALTLGKPILFYEDDKNCYYIDTMEKTGTDSITLTKGGKTILITSGNVVTEIGEIQPKLYTYEINDGDVFGVFYSDINFDEIRIASDATELTDADKVALTKLYKYLYGLQSKNILIPSISYSDSWLNSYIFITASVNKLTISINVVDASDVTSLLTGTYAFSVSDGSVTAIDSITDTTFEDAFHLYKKFNN